MVVRNENNSARRNSAVRAAILAATGFLVASWLPSSAAAQGVVTKSQVRVVKMQRVIDDSILGKSMRKDLEGEAKKAQGSTEALKREVSDLQTGIEKQKGLLSPSALEEKMRALSTKQRDLERIAGEQRDILLKSRERKLQDIVQKIDKVINEMAKGDGIDFVVESGTVSVLYASSKIDISDKVIDRLNKTYVGL